ncbi:Nif3-like dinuclear metal center hexameric protein [Neobacillus sp. DY30]|uniref:Nif3-like dinuclear metal center hexameric protein n=1 Tax=Neobacillus sp. DY30 TaxID=3047871 RepID=UPI0024BF2207|nr:Nif3-like dinuclear metal center hexameric protein [Neobacillus sp. DY30]WHY02842.1 Nif3-like dinuclear metal center hexameric protein [Neobacillus sp. DY30]
MPITVQNVLDKLMEPVERIPKTVDTLKAGNLGTEIKGIATAFMATHKVIEQTIALGANLLITHEGIYFSHHDDTEFLEKDPVYDEKRRLIIESGLAIYRFHDYWHRYQPDGIMAGLIQALDWQAYIEENQQAVTILTIPPMTLAQISEYLKVRLGIQYLRYSGDLAMRCTRIGLLAGYRGGGSLCIPLYEQEELDLIIYGEGPEWETPEYVRDAIKLGKNRNLIVLGHMESEEPGMSYLSQCLQSMFPSIPTYFIPVEQALQVI